MFLKKILLGLLSVIFVYGLIAGDLWLRARNAYREGEKYMRWQENPREKQEFFAKRLQTEKEKLDQMLNRKTLTSEEHQEKMELLEFNIKEALEDSSAKYAYIWYQSAAELFSPPESSWVRLARQKMPLAKELWKTELKAKKIPFEEYMLD